MTTIRDLATELRIPVDVVARCLADFGYLRPVSHDLTQNEIALVRENAEGLKSRAFIRGGTPPPEEGSDAGGVREPRRPRPSAGAAGATPPTQ